MPCPCRSTWPACPTAGTTATRPLRTAHGEFVAHAYRDQPSGELHLARWVQKVHPHRLLAFSSGEQGVLAWVESEGVRWRDGTG